MSYPLVSVVLTTFNGKHFVADVKKMLQSQTYQKFECLIVDDGSEDGTVECYQRLCDEDSRFRILNYSPQRNVGLSRQFGITQAMGTYLTILDHDDIWHPQKLEMQVNFLDNHQDIDFVYTDHTRFVDDANQIDFSKIDSYEVCQEEHFLSKVSLGNFVACDSIMMRSSSEKRIQGFTGTTSLKHCEDYFAVLKYARHAKVAKIRAVLVYCRVHSNNKSKANRLKLSHNLQEVADAFRVNKDHYIADRVEAQSYKTKSRFYFAKNPSRAYQYAYRSYQLCPRPVTFGMMLVTKILSLTGLKSDVSEELL